MRREWTQRLLLRRSYISAGDGVVEWAAEHGQTFDMRFMGASHVSFMSFESCL